MTTNEEGTNAYFHVFKYYEKIRLETIRKEECG